jgi:hypothetical protein
MRAPDPERQGHTATVDPRAVDAAPSLWSAPLEIAVFLGLALGVDTLWGVGNRFWDVEPHPFWIVVLLMAVHYGTWEALIASVASSAALLLGNLPAQRLDQDVHVYTIAVLLRPLLWTLASFVLGELRMRQRHRFADLYGELVHAERRIDLLSHAHGELSAAKDRLETRLAGQLRTATNMFQAARSLETLDPAAVLAGAADMLRLALNARSFSLFLLESDALVLAAAQGWEGRDGRPRRYDASSGLFTAIVTRHRLVSVVTPEGEEVLQGHGLMAAALVHPDTGQLLGMIKIEELAFLDFNTASLQTFRALCDWIAAAYANALTHKTTQMVDESTRLYGSLFLDRQADYLTHVARRFRFDLSLLVIRVDVAGLSVDQVRQLPAVLGDIARQVLRRTDLASDHDGVGGFAVLLPGAPPENVVVVATKLVERLRAVLGPDVACRTEVRSLHHAGEPQPAHGPARDGKPANGGTVAGTTGRVA